MSLDLVLRHCRIAGREEASVDIGVKDGLHRGDRTAIAGFAPSEDVGGRLVLPGFVETHIHLDKSCILDRCRTTSGSLDHAIAAVAAAKRNFTEEDVYARAQRTLEKAILHGTTRMRTHVEIDPRIGLRSFNAIKKLKDDYAWAIDLEICVFPQEGLAQRSRRRRAAGRGLPERCRSDRRLSLYRHQAAAIRLPAFLRSRRNSISISTFHLDFDLDPSWMHLHEVCRQTIAHRWGGRVAIGHVTKLSALPPHDLDTAAALLSGSGIALTILPATDLYLMGRDHEHNVPRGVTPAHRLLASRRRLLDRDQ